MVQYQKQSCEDDVSLFTQEVKHNRLRGSAAFRLGLGLSIALSLTSYSMA
jgi:hypothetical protein